VGRTRSELAHVEALRQWTAEHFPGAVETHQWSAQDYSPHDGVPFVGLLPRGLGRIYVATGFDKWGMTNAAAAGHVLAGDLLGSPPAYASGLRSTGVSPRDVADAARHNTSVGTRWFGDRLRRLVPGGPTTPPAEGTGRVEGGPIGPTAVSTVDGRTCRVSAVCPHLAGILTWNDVERSWDCPLHGSRFTADGRLVEGPATSGLDPRDA
jgi:nitrite reductase/ring-hydroxylating ferredoxin subunit